MKTADCDILRMDIFREVMDLNKDKLEKVNAFIKSLQTENTATEELPAELLESAVEYTHKVIANGGPFYSTEEVFDESDKDMGWK